MTLCPVFNVLFPGFLALACLTSFHYVAAMCDGPGFVPLGWRPQDPKEEGSLQYCESCKGFKSPRAHHCRKCELLFASNPEQQIVTVLTYIFPGGRCVMKMDHHCPWINTCVGHLNHGHFIGFLFFAVVGCTHGSVVLGSSLYYGLNRVSNGQYCPKTVVRFGIGLK